MGKKRSRKTKNKRRPKTCFKEIPIDVEKEAMEIIKGNVLLEIFTPALRRVIEISYRIKTDTSALIPTISIIRYKQEKGDYPENLEEISCLVMVP